MGSSIWWTNYDAIVDLLDLGLIDNSLDLPEAM